MNTNTNTHKVITTKEWCAVTQSFITHRTYRGVDINKYNDGTFSFVAIAYLIGIKANSHRFCGNSTLKNAVAEIDRLIDQRNNVVVAGRVLSPAAVTHQAVIDARKAGR